MIASRHLIVAVLIASAAACSAPTASPTAGGPAPAVVAPEPQLAEARTAEQVVTGLAAKVDTVKPTIVYTAETDPNKLLGRPNGYSSKASFTDSRIETSSVKDDSSGSVNLGGSVEVYADEARATARKQYIDGLMKAKPMLGTEYSYIASPVLLRMSQELTPDQAAEYETALPES